MTHTGVQALGQTRIAELHDQARRDALVLAGSATLGNTGAWAPGRPHPPGAPPGPGSV